MAKWADFCIPAVQFNPRRTHIDQVRVHQDKGETIGPGTPYARQSVVAALRSGNTFVTILTGPDGKWQLGENVFIVHINGDDYIKTVDNGRAQDNLDNLPEF